MVVDVVWISRFSMYLPADWHRERRLPTLDELADLGVPIPDLALGLLLSGHYRRPRKVNRTDLRRGIAFWDAPTVRRRWARLTERLEPLPEVRSHADAVALLSPDGRRVLAGFDAAMSGDLNTPRALALLYRAQRDRAGLPDADRAVLAATARTLVPVAMAAP